MSKGNSEVKTRKSRTTFEEKDKKIFVSIIKSSEGGRFARVITSKDPESECSVTSATNQQRHDVWNDVSIIFGRSIGKDVSANQCKQLWCRMKADAKKEHDSKTLKFKRTCAITGGGKAPKPPPELDGDEIDPIFADDYDPNPTPYNKLFTSEDRTSAAINKNNRHSVVSSSFRSSIDHQRKRKSLSLPKAAENGENIASHLRANDDSTCSPHRSSEHSDSDYSPPFQSKRPRISLLKKKGESQKQERVLQTLFPKRNIHENNVNNNGKVLCTQYSEDSIPINLDKEQSQFLNLDSSINVDGDDCNGNGGENICSSTILLQDKEVLIVNKNSGESIKTSAYEQNKSKNLDNNKIANNDLNTKKKSKTSIKNMNDEAVTYFSNIESIQRSLFEKKAAVLSQQLKVWEKKEKSEDLRILYYQKLLKGNDNVTVKQMSSGDEKGNSSNDDELTDGLVRDDMFNM